MIRLLKIDKFTKCRVILPIYILFKSSYKTLPGNYCEGVTPDPIPNSEVKSFSANGTSS